MRIDSKAEPVARRIHKRGMKKKAHWVAPPKCKGLIQTESRLEASAAIAIGLDPRVTSFRPQPASFDLATGRKYRSAKALSEATSGKGRCYTPDFEVKLGRAIVYVEVKHSALIRKYPDTLLLPRMFAGFGWKLILVDENLLCDTFVQNTRLIWPWYGHAVADQTVQALQEECREPRSFASLTEGGRTQADILSLLASGHLATDLAGARLNSRSLIITAAGVATDLMRLPFPITAEKPHA
ncbi:hypothetical protein [Paracoccus ravus]|uniref:hypothetical protein n=1 Tax=Paracoccus ravus TaxID=2447760 RepID=UPI00106E0775|nr:hypothetical protein [Paracoccus ravus]